MSNIFFDISFLGQQSNKSYNNKQNNLSQNSLQEARKGLIAERDITRYRHSSIYAVNVGTHKKKTQKRKPHKSWLLSSTKGEANRIQL